MPPRWYAYSFNTLRPRQNGRHFIDDIFKCIFLNENVWISIKISLKFVPKGPINNIPALVQILARRRPCDKPLSEAMIVKLPTHICVTWPQWVNKTFFTYICIRLYVLHILLAVSDTLYCKYPPNPILSLGLVNDLVLNMPQTITWIKGDQDANLTPYDVAMPQCVNSSSLSAAYMRQRIGSVLVEIMACRLFSAKPLYMKISSAKWRPCCPGPCITNVFATRRKNFSQWHRSFQRKLRSHWLKFLRHVAITLVIQGPGEMS